MSIFQFLRIFWARRMIIIAAAISCVIGAYVVTRIVPPRWEASSRVMLNLLKPDPVTGQVVNGEAARGYVATQVQIIKDYSVAGQVADQLGWLSDPTLIADYQGRSKNDTRDFRRWIAQRVIDRTKTKLVEGSNILEITYWSTTPSGAKLVADALRKAYIDQSVRFKRDDAAQSADWYETQAKKAQTELDAAQVAKAGYEKENGIVMSNDKTDLESARLSALANIANNSAGSSAGGGSPLSAASSELTQLDAAIGQAAKVLGPNHPDLQAMRAKRAALASQVAQERANAGAGVPGAGAAERALNSQKTKVIGERDKLARLSQLQDEVDLRRDQFNKISTRAADAREGSAVVDVGLTPLGNAVTPASPVFPNVPLIMFGSLGLGLAFGVAIALLAELMGRRVRGVEDLQRAVDVPVLAVVGGSAKDGAQSARSVNGRLRQLAPVRNKASQA